ncbi:hypothetical protein ACRFW0_002972 [Vibrio cholerae]|nr:hypothetical protein [Vibrio cholerae]
MKQLKNNRWIFIYSSLALVSLYIRYKYSFTSVGVWNQESTYHVLLTIKSLIGNEFSFHHLLPTVTLPGQDNYSISWGATMPTENGAQIYTSFGSLGFIIAAIPYYIFSISPTLTSLYYYNFLLLFFSGYLFLITIRNMYDDIGQKSLDKELVTFSVTLLLMFNSESLLSHGINFWVHSIFQLVLSAGIYSFYNYVNHNKNFILLLFICYVGPQIEWTGYIFNIGVFVFLLIFKKNDYRKLLYIAITTFAAGTTQVIHFSSVLGLNEYMQNLFYRFTSRNITKSSFLDLYNGYKDSYGYFLLTTLFIGTIVLSKKKTPSAILATVGICIFVNLENIIMLQHAVQFSFDRLKLSYFLSMLILLTFINGSRIVKHVFTLLVLISAVYSISTFISNISQYNYWKEINKQNSELAQESYSKLNDKCKIIASSVGVRGYANILFNQSIYEYIPKQSLEELKNISKVKCGDIAVVYLEGCGGDFPIYNKMTLISEERTDSTYTAINFCN